MDSSLIILNIETSAGISSVALGRGQQLLVETISDGVNKTADCLHLQIQEVMDKAGIAFKDLAAVAISGGPGSYTGLRIGASAAKGISYALNIPLIHVETFQAMRLALLDKISQSFDYYVPMLDARRMDAFLAVIDKNGEYLLKPSCVTMEDNTLDEYSKRGSVMAFGNNIGRFRSIIEKHNVLVEDGIVLTSKSLIPISYVKLLQSEFEDTVYYEPNYYKSFHSSIK